jgi:hypothetical protein
VPRKSTVFLVLAAFALAPLTGWYCAWSCAGEGAAEHTEIAVVSHQPQIGSDLAPAVAADEACSAYHFQPAAPATAIQSAPVAMSVAGGRLSPEPAIVSFDAARAITPRCGAPPGAHLGLSLRI